MALLEVVGYRAQTLPKERIRGFALDGPRFRGKAPEEAVEFNGWVVGHPVRVDYVDLQRGDETIHRMAADKLRIDVGTVLGDTPGSDRSGFKERLDLSMLAPAADLRLVAVFADGGELVLAQMSLRWAESALAAVGSALDVDIAGLQDRGEAVVLPRASIIVPVYGKSEFTRQCLNTILAETAAGPRHEVIVVDDNSPDDTAAVLAEYGGKIRVVTLPQNSGFAAACNAGAVAARGDYLIFLNNDTVAQPGWLSALVGYANVTPSAAVVGAKLLFLDHTIQHAGVAIGLDGYPHHLYAGFAANHPAVDKPRRFQIVTAACCLVRRGAFFAVNGFDRAFVNGWEDTDLCLRLGERGYEVHYTPQSVVYHVESVSRDPSSGTERHNRELYARRWLGKARRDMLDFFVADGLLRVVNETPLYPLLWEPSALIASVKLHENDLEQQVLEQREQIVQLQRAVADLEGRLLARAGRAKAPVAVSSA